MELRKNENIFNENYNIITILDLHFPIHIASKCLLCMGIRQIHNHGGGFNILIA